METRRILRRYPATRPTCSRCRGRSQINFRAAPGCHGRVGTESAIQSGGILLRQAIPRESKGGWCVDQALTPMCPPYMTSMCRRGRAIGRSRGLVSTFSAKRGRIPTISPWIFPSDRVMLSVPGTVSRLISGEGFHNDSCARWTGRGDWLCPKRDRCLSPGEPWAMYRKWCNAV